MHHLSAMAIRKLTIDDETNERLNDLLKDLGYIYEETKTRTRYDLGGFLKDLLNSQTSRSLGHPSISYVKIIMLHKSKNNLK